MAKCKICERNFKRLTSTHIKTHGMTMQEYNELYDSEKHRERVILDFIKEHYITVRYRYIKYALNGVVYTVDVRSSTEKKVIPLTDSNIINHIRGNYSIGVYFPEHHTKFIGLDLDVLDVDKLEQIYNALWSYGIPKQSVFISFSGNKGYHIDILLNSMISKSVVFRFHEMLLNELELSDKELEIRGAGAQGYKLPLGTHVKTGEYCYSCDEHGQEIDDIRAVQGIVKADTELIYNALDMNYETTVNEKQIIEREELKNSIPYNPLYENKGRRKKIEQVLKQGVSETGNRNNLCLEVAMYCKDIENLCTADTIERIRSWIAETWTDEANPQEFLSSDIIEDMTKRVYQRNYKFNSKYDDLIGFTETEIQEVFTVTDRHGRKQEGLRKLYHAMIIHAKGYAGTDGIFYMTYEQIRALGIGNKNTLIKKQIEELIKLGKVKRYEPHKERMSNGKTPPYRYKLPVYHEIRNQGTKQFTCDNTSRCKDCIYITHDCLVNGQEIPNNSCHAKMILL